jgi:short-subunit dehydrogenase
MLERGRGDQIIFASLMGLMPTMHLGGLLREQVRVRAFAEILYHENLNSGLRFACVCPPMVETPLLSQVTTNPKTMDEAEVLSPTRSSTRSRRASRRASSGSRPGQAKYGATAARLVPNLIWKNMHKIEGIA